jgi:hypothetical protein
MATVYCRTSSHYLAEKVLETQALRVARGTFDKTAVGNNISDPWNPPDQTWSSA